MKIISSMIKILKYMEDKEDKQMIVFREIRLLWIIYMLILLTKIIIKIIINNLVIMF